MSPPSQPPPSSLLLFGGLALGGLSGLFSLPFFSVGIWHDTEPVVVALWVAGALCHGGLFLHHRTSAVAFATLYAHPLVFLPLALGMWSLITAPLAPFPMASILGPPQTGEGALWYLTLSGLTAAALVVRHHGWHWRSLLVLLASTAAIVAAISIGNNPHLRNLLPLARLLPEGTLFGFNDHLAYFTPSLLALGYGMWIERAYRVAKTLIAIALFCLLISQNTAGLLLACLTLPLIILLHHRLHATAAAPMDLTPPTILTALLTVVIPALAYLLIRYGARLLEIASLGSRKVLQGVLTVDLADPLHALWTGHGWGHYGEYLTRNLGEVNIRLHDIPWPDVHIDQFHSHHRLLESAFAAGLPGLILASLAVMALPLVAERRHWPAAVLLALFLSGLDALWFQMPSSLALLAMAQAAVARPEVRLLPRAALPRWLAMTTSALMAAGLLWAAVATWQFAREMSRLESCLHQDGSTPSSCFFTPPPVLRESRTSLARLATTLVDRMEPSQPQSATVRAWLVNLDPGQSLPLHIALINGFAKTAFSPHPASPLNPQEMARWGMVTRQALTLAPGRLDLTTLHLNRLIALDRMEAMRPILEPMHQLAPGHPVTLWFQGILSLGDPSPDARQKGLLLMRDALKGGVERFMPVDEMLKQQLLSTAPSG